MTPLETLTKSSPSTNLRLEKSRPDISWVKNLAGTTVRIATEYVSEGMEDYEFEMQIADVLEAGGRDNYVQIAAPVELYALGRLLKPGHMVEIGVSAGVSSAYLLKAIERNGRGTLHSIDLPESQIGSTYSPKNNAAWCIPPGKSPGWGVPAELKENWDLRLGSSGKVLPELMDEIDEVGLFLYDVPYTKESAISDFKLVDEKLRNRSAVMADNCLAPFTWWAKRRHANAYRRRDTGLRGFRVNE